VDIQLPDLVVHPCRVSAPWAAHPWCALVSKRSDPPREPTPLLAWLRPVSPRVPGARAPR
jgi:hypothetical protein